MNWVTVTRRPMINNILTEDSTIHVILPEVHTQDLFQEHRKGMRAVFVYHPRQHHPFTSWVTIHKEI